MLTYSFICMVDKWVNHEKMISAEIKDFIGPVCIFAGNTLLRTDLLRMLEIEYICP